jgi:VIT1/CCC1 family predicted Fe2+/Mn2+ transporter
MNASIKNALIDAQRNEITEHHVYARLAKATRDSNNRKVLESISKDELKHYQMLGRLSGIYPQPYHLHIWFYTLLSRVFGLTFGVKWMETGEGPAAKKYKFLAQTFPGIQAIARDEIMHEKKLLGLLDEDFLKYVSSIVLGINDALVELTGAMAGLTFALSNSRVVALTGIITGVAGGLSMAASEYLSKRHEKDALSPVKSSIYTGIAYLLTLALLVFPYLLPISPYLALTWMIGNALLVIFLFTSYISVALEHPFWSRFLEMAGLSISVAAVSFGIGALAQHFLGVKLG